MFDRITVLVPLPTYPADAPRDGFWTTDFGCDETGFTIDNDGRLLSELWHREPVPAEEQEFREDLNCLLRASGETKKVVDGSVRRDFTGILHFSRYYQDKLYAFEAEFLKGVLKQLTLHRIQDSGEKG
jgi:hypothetical protein